MRRGTIGAVTTATANDTLETKKVHEKVLKGRAMSRKAGQVVIAHDNDN